MAADALDEEFSPDLILIESGGDNLASTFSRELVDHWVFVIDVAGGDDIPRKRGTRRIAMRSSGGEQDRSRTLCEGRSPTHARRSA